MKFLIQLLFFLLIAIFLPQTTFAQTPVPSVNISSSPVANIQVKEEPAKAKVLRITEEGVKIIYNQQHPFQKVELEILDGPEKHKRLTITHGEQTTLREDQKVQEGQTVVLLKTTNDNASLYQIIDSYRLDKSIPFVILFLAVVLIISRLKGLGALIGLIISLVIIISFIVPTILSGEDPLITSIVGSFLIMVTTMYIAHGFSKKTHIALFSTTLALILTGALAYLSVNMLHLTGLGNDDAVILLYGPTGSINFQGLLLGGIIIGSLGALNDITIGLSAALKELALTNPKISFKSLFNSGIRIGSEHIAALVNTLALAYAGAALPVFLFIVLNPSNQPLWLILNSELLQEEIVRTLAGSIGLVLSVPLTALLGAFAFQTKR